MVDMIRLLILGALMYGCVWGIKKLDLITSINILKGEVIMTWLKSRQKLCWLLSGRDEWECYVTIRTSWPGELICDRCEHNKWRKVECK